MKNELQFTGIITAADFQGVVDGNDYITVNETEVQLSGGKSSMNETWGKIVGIDLGQLGTNYVGKTVKVFARKYINKVNPNNTFSQELEENKLTIQGSKNYFVEVIQ